MKSRSFRARTAVGEELWESAVGKAVAALPPYPPATNDSHRAFRMADDRFVVGAPKVSRDARLMRGDDNEVGTAFLGLR